MKPATSEKPVNGPLVGISTVATILHLSDLHLGKNFSDSGKEGKASVIGLLRKKGLKMQSHDPVILNGLYTEIRAAARSVGAIDDSYDFYVITGDIVTNGSHPARFEFAEKFITQEVPISKIHDYEPDRNVGLRLHGQSLFCVPGNHDVMDEETPERYLKQFGNYPAPPPYVHTVEARNGQRFMFLGIDSNTYEEGNIALGKISDVTLNWLRERLFEIGNGRNDTVRILLLHHHPVDLNQFRAWRPSRLYDSFSVLQNPKELLDLARGRIDIIMHGHEHFPIAFQDKISGCIIVSAGSASEWHRYGHGKNSFHVLVFHGPDLEVTKFDWADNRFNKALQSFTFTLQRP